MGEVFRARDTRLGRDVAVKVLPSDFAGDADRLRRFEQEAKTLAALNHPNVLTIHDAGVHDGSPYLVSELLEGRTLREALAPGGLSTRLVSDYAVQIAQGLSAAHGKGIVHRDLKPENLFVTTDGRVKILDFGLAKLKNPSPDLRPPSPHPMGRGQGEGQSVDRDAGTLMQPADEATEPGRVMGTPNYMAPEQVRGELVDHRADIFSFGCVLFEMVSGRRPFKRDTKIETMSAILKEEPPDLLVTKPDLPPAFARVIHRCLEKLPERRFQSASDLAFALEAVGDSRAVPRTTSQEGGSKREAQISKSKIQSSKYETEKNLTTSSATRFGWVTGMMLLVVGVGWWLVEQSGQPTKPGPHSSTNASPSHPAAASSLAPAADQKSIAVLPFVNMSADKADEYLSDGMTEELLNALARVKGLRVPGRSSSFAFKGKTERDIFRQVGEQLHVSAVLEGSVRKVGNQLRITTQLINVADGFHLWSETYDRDMTNIFAIQSDVSQKVAAALKIQLGVEDIQSINRQPTQNLEAYNLYLQGRFYYARWTTESFVTSIDYLNRAVQLDPKFAMAYAQLAEVQMVSIYSSGSPSEVISKARLAAQRALDLDDMLADSHYAMGVVRLYEWKWEEAEHEIKRALAINPNHAMSHDWYGWYFVANGRIQEALREMRRAQELEPLHGIINPDLAILLIYAREYDKALAQCKYTLKVDPGNFQGFMNLGTVHALQGDYRNAASAFQQAKVLDPDSGWVVQSIGWLNVLSGKRGETIELVRSLELAAVTDVRMSDTVAYLYSVLGDADQSFKWLNKAFEARVPFVLSLQLDPGWDNIRNDPRYAQFLKKLGLAK